MKITEEISNIKSANNDIKEVRHNDVVVWGGGELIVKITFFDRRKNELQVNEVFVYSDDPKDKENKFKSGETRDIKPILKNGENYIKVKTTGGVMQSSLIIKEKNGNWQKSIINKDDFVIGITVFDVELTNASNNKEYIIEFNK